MRTAEDHIPTLLSVKLFAQKHPAFTEGSLRWLIFNASPQARATKSVPSNGFDQAIVRIGRRVLIDEEAFFKCLKQANPVRRCNMYDEDRDTNANLTTNDAVQAGSPNAVDSDTTPSDDGSADVSSREDATDAGCDNPLSEAMANRISMPEMPPSSSSALDISSLRLSQDFTAEANVNRPLLTVPVRKPDRQEFVRVHSDDRWWLPTMVLDLREEGETYLVAQELWSELRGEIVAKVLFTTINTQGVLTLWPVRLPDDDGRLDPWNQSALVAAHQAKSQWIRVASNRSLGAYEVLTATGNIADPQWPDLTFEQVVGVAFQDKFISNLDHPVIRRLRGAT